MTSKVISFARVLICLALDLLGQLLRFSPHERIDVIEALTHPYVGTYHDESDEPLCHDVFDKWEQVEGLETIEELREAITREIEEYRAEVRNVIIESDEDEDEEEDPEEYDLEGNTEETITGLSPARHPTDETSTVPFPRSTSLSPTITQKDLGHGISPRTQMQQLPVISRTRSRGRGTGSTPQSPALEESSSTSSTGVPISRTSSRRTSGYSMQGRRPASFLFSPFGNGMTPLPSNISQANGGAGIGQNAGINQMSNLNAISSSTGSSAGLPSGGPGGSTIANGHGHSASMDFYNGRRSRAPSATGEFSLRPLIRQLSTVGMGVGGDDGVPLPGAESSRVGLELEGLPPAPTGSKPGVGGEGGDDGGPGAGGVGNENGNDAGLPDDRLPPMNVTPSDAPPTTVRSDPMFLPRTVRY